MEMELHFSLIIITLILFLFMAVKGRLQWENRNSKLPPGPWKLPLIGSLHHFLLGHLPHHTLRDLAKKHGPLMFLQMGEVGTIIASSPRIAMEIFKTNDMVFADRVTIYTANIVTYGSIGMGLAPYSEHWKQLRRICTLELLSAKKVQSFLSVREEEVANLIEVLSSMAETRTPVNISQKMFSLVNDITCRSAFGKKFAERERFQAIIEEVLELCSCFEIADIFPSYKFLHWLSRVKHRSEKVHHKTDKILDKIMNEHRLNGKGNNIDEDLVDVLLRLQQENVLESPIDDNCIKAVLVEVFIAGTETSATILEWAFSELIRNPKVMKKAQSEVRRVFDGQTKVAQSDLNKLSYLKLVIKETLRLHTPTPLLVPRQSRERCEIDGYEIPKGARVFTNAWAMGRDPEHWSDPETFNPERFQDLDIDYKGNNFEFIPFGAGRRICPGLNFGIANIEFPLAQLLYHFEWKLPNGLIPEELDMTERFGSTVGRKSNLCLIPTPYGVLD